MIQPAVLIVLDGWGIAPPGPGNAISLAHLQSMPYLWHTYPHTELAASGEAVGLPFGEDGNTETGHVNIGAGRVVLQDLPRISMSVADGSFFENKAFLGAIQNAKNHQSNIHLMGIVSDAGVHSSREHLYALLELLKRHGCVTNVFIHVFTDGRDAPPKSGLRFITELEDTCRVIGTGIIATIMGRYFALDRDRRWERTELAYQALTEKIPNRASDPHAVLTDSYKKDITDEFIRPTVLTDKNGNVYPRITNHDSVIFFNYRIDRPRQLTRAFIQQDFETRPQITTFDPYAVKYHGKHVISENIRQKSFSRSVLLSDIFFVTMTEYEPDLHVVVAYPTVSLHHTLGEIISLRNIRQLRVSETEKERFVTYYFSGMHEVPFAGEDRMIVPSPMVATYDLLPQMSAADMTNKIIDRLNLGIYSFVLVNFANPDMVGHTGNIRSAVRACETVDASLSALTKTILDLHGSCIITADHGNVEEMLSADGGMDTEHSTFPVPCIMINKKFEGYGHTLPKGKLADIAPTILSLMEIEQPDEMTGKNLLTDFL